MDSLKNEERLLYLLYCDCDCDCDCDPSSTFGEAIVKALTLGLAADFCLKPEPASK